MDHVNDDIISVIRIFFILPMNTFTLMCCSLLCHIVAQDAESESNKVLRLWKQIPTYLDEGMLRTISDLANDRNLLLSMNDLMQTANQTFNHTHVSFIEESASDPESQPSFAPQSGNPQCDIGIEGPRTVKRVIAGQTTDNPFNRMPSFGFDLAETTKQMLEKSESAMAVGTTSNSLSTLVAMMFVKNLFQTTAATVAAIVPQGIPPPVWNLRPFPCMPMLSGSNCFGAVMYPITFSDTMLADMTDSVLTNTIKQFRSMFKERAGLQPDFIYQRCYKAYMSMMCSSIFPMCTNIQGQNEFIPFLGRVPMCFTSCLAVLALCPGFSFIDIEGPCTDVSIPPLCAQAVYLKDDLEGQRTVEDELAEKLNSKCHNYDPEIDAGQDPYLYEEEPAVKLFHDQHDMQSYIG